MWEVKASENDTHWHSVLPAVAIAICTSALMVHDLPLPLSSFFALLGAMVVGVVSQNFCTSLGRSF